MSIFFSQEVEFSDFSNCCFALFFFALVDRDMRPMYHGRKNGYKRQRSQMTVPFKKRRLFDRSTVGKSDGGITSESFFDSGKKGITGNAPASCSKMQGGHFKTICFSI